MKRYYSFTNLTCLFIIHFILIWINPAHAGTHYVDISQVSEGDGSALTPWKTLHYAIQQINAASPDNYLLNVAAGTYSVTNGEADARIEIYQDNVTIQGAGAGSTIINGRGMIDETWQIGIEIYASNVTISGCEVSNFYMNGINIYTGTGQIVEDCDIHDNDWGIYTANSSPEIRKNKIYDNTTRGIYITVFDSAAYAPVIKNNLIYVATGTMGYGIEVYTASTGSIASPSIYHNTIDGGTQYGIYIREDVEPITAEIKYNIITNFAAGISFLGTTPSMTIDYNDVYGNTTNYNGCTAGTNDISLDPIYVGGGDYNLQSGSPCIDAITAGDPVSDDLEGNTRPQGSGYDMGCYESGVANAWHTFMGSVSSDDGYAIAVDGSGNIYVAGSSDTTWGSPNNPHSGSYDAFAVKLNSGGAMQWNTFIGSAAYDQGFGIAVDGSGNVYLTGRSDATWGTPVRPHAGGNDAFIAKLNSNGDLQWNTFMGSASNDQTDAIAVDNSFVYVAGESGATWGSPVNPYTGSDDALAAKLDSSSGVLQWHTFMGSGVAEHAYGIAVDGSGNAYVAGYSAATWGSPINDHAGSSDFFVTKLNSSGALQWHTFMGGADSEYPYGTTVDASGNIYISGECASTWGSPINAHSGASFDTCVVKLNSSGGLLWNTFMGASSNASNYDAVAVDSSGNVYVAGSSDATWGSPDNAHAGSNDAFAARLNSGGALQSHTFMGSTHNDYGNGIAVDDSGNVYVVGSGDNWGTPINPHAGGDDAFVDKFELGGVSLPSYTLTVTIVGQGSVTLSPSGGIYNEGTVVTLTAVPDSGCTFMAWSGALTGSASPETLTMDADKNVTATFNCPPDTPTASSPADEAILSSGPVTINTTIFSDPDSGDTHTESHWLVRRADSVYYRADYDPSFDVVSTSDLTQHTVSGLNSGMKYVWKVGYTDSGSGQTSWSQEISFMIGTSEADSSVVISSGTEEADFTMVSFVQWPDHSMSSSAFDITYDKKYFRIGTYDPTNGSGGYVEYGSSLMIEPGKAYWFLARDGLPLTVNGIPVSLTDDIDVGLLFNASNQNGWNMIGCPNPANYNWDDVQVIEYNPNDGSIVFPPTAISALPDPNNYIEKSLWRWESGTYYPDAILMEKYKGYWVKAKKANVFLRFRESVQIASVSTPPTYFARLLRNGKRWMERWMFTPDVAIADSYDSPPRPMGDFSTVTPDSVGGCFIATAVYGSPMERHVTILRDFRDLYLINSTIGHRFVTAYYHYSPSLADCIAKHKVLKAAARISFLPMVAFCYSALTFGLAVTTCAFLLMFMAPIFFIFMYKRRV